MSAPQQILETILFPDDLPTVGPDYASLVALFPLRPLRTPKARDDARAMMRALLRVERNDDQADYLTVLGSLIREYDADHVVLPVATQADVLRALMEDRDVTQARVAFATGIPDSHISAILKGTRFISRANRAKLAEFFEVAPTRFAVD